MHAYQLTITAMATICTVITLGVAAAPNDKAKPDKAGHEQQSVYPHKDGRGSQSSDVKIVSRENEGRGNGDNRGNENSNHQSGFDSTRGQERAEERRSGNADQHGWSDGEPRWYDFIFGGHRNKDHDMADQHARSDGEHHGEHHWYDFIFGENKDKGDKDKNHDLAGKKLRWWWPFN